MIKDFEDFQSQIDRAWETFRKMTPITGVDLPAIEAPVVPMDFAARLAAMRFAIDSDPAVFETDQLVARAQRILNFLLNKE